MNTCLSEGFFTLIGFVAGGSLSLLGVYLTNRNSSKIEREKITLSLLLEKIKAIEKFNERCPSFNYTGNIEEDEGDINDEYKFILEFVNQKSHYFFGSSDFQELDNMIEHKDDYSPSDMTHLKYSYILVFHKFVRNELNAAMRKIEKFGIKV